MSSVVISGNTSGSVTLDAPAVAGSTVLTLAAESGTISPLVSGTTVASTSGTSIDFTGIPSWAKRVSVMLSGVSLSGTDGIIVQLGTAGGVETTGYIGGAGNRTAEASSTSGFRVAYAGTASAASGWSGILTINSITGNTWVASGAFYASADPASLCGGATTLSGTLDRIRVRSTGTNTFDGGSINIMYE